VSRKKIKKFINKKKPPERRNWGYQVNEAESYRPCLPARNVLTWEKSQCKKKVSIGTKK